MLELKKRKVLRKYGVDLWGVLYSNKGKLERSRFVNFFFELYKEQFKYKLRFRTGMSLVLNKYLQYRLRFKECRVFSYTKDKDEDKYKEKEKYSRGFLKLFPYMYIKQCFSKKNKIPISRFFF